jgi:transcriptional antiterminator RfaH
VLPHSTDTNYLWYVIYTTPRAEKKVESQLRLRKYETYLPLQKTIRQWSDRKKMVEVPLFSSYIFIKTNIGKTYYDILNVPGVVKFIKIGKELAVLKEEQIGQIKLLLENFDDLLITNEKIEATSEVEIIAGPLKGLTGTVIEIDKNKYFCIEIEQLGNTILIHLLGNYIKKV